MTDLSPDGPHEPGKTHQAAREVSDLTRYLAYATRPGSGGLEHATDVYELLAALSEAASRLPQSLRQCGEFLEAQARDGKLGDTERQRPDLAAAITSSVLSHAAVLAEQLAGKLSRAQSEMAGLYSLEGGDL